MLSKPSEHRGELRTQGVQNVRPSEKLHTSPVPERNELWSIQAMMSKLHNNTFLQNEDFSGKLELKMDVCPKTSVYFMKKKTLLRKYGGRRSIGGRRRTKS